MDSVDKQCSIIKNLDSDSTAVFGGLPVVIALGDFHQFLGWESGSQTLILHLIRELHLFKA